MQALTRHTRLIKEDSLPLGLSLSVQDLGGLPRLSPGVLTS
jgi:hypothetical protein